MRAGIIAMCDIAGREWTQAESRTYYIQEIISYLQERAGYPQYETRVSFVIRDSGELSIVTSAQESRIETETSDFCEV